MSDSDHINDNDDFLHQCPAHQYKGIAISNLIKLQSIARGFLTRRRHTLSPPSLSHPGDCPYIPTPSTVVIEALKRVALSPDDVLVDLGCGDGRVVIAASEHFGSRAIGVELDALTIAKARASRRELAQRDAAAANRISFLQTDFADVAVAKLLSTATMVWLFLTPRAMTRLLPSLIGSIGRGASIVTYTFPLSSMIVADRILDLGDAGPDHMSTLYVYNAVSLLGGHWQNPMRLV